MMLSLHFCYYNVHTQPQMILSRGPYFNFCKMKHVPWLQSNVSGILSVNLSLSSKKTGFVQKSKFSRVLYSLELYILLSQKKLALHSYTAIWCYISLLSGTSAEVVRIFELINVKFLKLCLSEFRQFSSKVAITQYYNSQYN